MSHDPQADPRAGLTELDGLLEALEQPGGLFVVFHSVEYKHEIARLLRVALRAPQATCRWCDQSPAPVTVCETCALESARARAALATRA